MLIRIIHLLFIDLVSRLSCCHSLYIRKIKPYYWCKAKASLFKTPPCWLFFLSNRTPPYSSSSSPSFPPCLAGLSIITPSTAHSSNSSSERKTRYSSYTYLSFSVCRKCANPVGFEPSALQHRNGTVSPSSFLHTHTEPLFLSYSRKRHDR